VSAKERLEETIAKTDGQLVDLRPEHIRELCRMALREMSSLEEENEAAVENNDEIRARFTALTVRLDEVMKKLREIRRSAANET
jgi:HPt (histidine-containing phosphotransfer) domain-containing protein